MAKCTCKVEYGEQQAKGELPNVGIRIIFGPCHAVPEEAVTLLREVFAVPHYDDEQGYCFGDGCDSTWSRSHLRKGDVRIGGTEDLGHEIHAEGCLWVRLDNFLAQYKERTDVE